MKLKKSVIDGLKYTGDASKNERCIIWADEPNGFGVRVYPSGKRRLYIVIGMKAESR